MSTPDFAPLGAAEASDLECKISVLLEAQDSLAARSLELCGELDRRFHETKNPIYQAIAWNVSCAVACSVDDNHFVDAIAAITDPDPCDAGEYTSTRRPPQLDTEPTLFTDLRIGDAHSKPKQQSENI